jgi:hypothetical protein
MTVSEWVLGRLAARSEVDPAVSGYGPLAGSCERSNELSRSGARS